MTALVIVAGFLTATVHAEIQTYEGTGEYYMNDFETFDMAQQRAKKRAEQNACEQAGVFVKSFSRSVNSKLVEDEIIAVTSGILKILDVQFHRESFDNNTTLVRATIKTQIDSDDVLKWLNKDSQERSSLVAQNEALRKANADQERQIAELKRQLSAATTKQEQEKIRREFVDEDKIFLSNQKSDDAMKLYYAGNYEGAIKLYDEALKLNPNNAQALNGRGFVYNGLNRYEQAIQNFDKAVELKPNDAYAYTGRGFAYSNLKQYERAIQDYSKAIELNPNDALAYNNRGLTYLHLGQYERSIPDFDKAIELNPNMAVAYNNRALANFYMGNFNQTIADADKATELDPKLGTAYYIRGLAYQKLGDNAKAQAEFDKAKQLGYNG